MFGHYPAVLPRYIPLAGALHVVASASLWAEAPTTNKLYKLQAIFALKEVVGRLLEHQVKQQVTVGAHVG